LSRPKVLVVDDESVTVGLLKLALERWRACVGRNLAGKRRAVFEHLGHNS